MTRSRVPDMTLERFPEKITPLCNHICENREAFTLGITDGWFRTSDRVTINFEEIATNKKACKKRKAE
ncbi:hypothetical protein KCU89_g122, partial [Aureobasidium melanogenum]